MSKKAKKNGKHNRLSHAIKMEKTARVQNCTEAIERVLKRFNCTMIADPFISQGSIGARVILSANDQE